MVLDGEEGRVKISGNVNPGIVFWILERHGVHAQVSYIRLDGEVQNNQYYNNIENAYNPHRLAYPYPPSIGPQYPSHERGPKLLRPPPLLPSRFHNPPSFPPPPPHFNNPPRSPPPPPQPYFPDPIRSPPPQFHDPPGPPPPMVVPTKGEHPPKCCSIM